MHSTRIKYRGYRLQPLAAYESGEYVAMFIVQSPDGRERASSVLGSFGNADEARQFALERGMAEVDSACRQL
ncbi:hypothetical protein AN416_30835 (plasmid) [Paraburkholderia caribensis]|jgi:hypothetical protein|nr:hypothetical protein AN416_26490 [Paraburkholderia caribensis]ALP67103.1 hypothetical protein AN416_30835 [Paraburkholderia caribensis]AMV47680.1 hypothetical protein ATN79_44220 [Paraburkholderia caribensis]AUT55029.1 hypothetical protein C2L66_24985 [Paraburkholderia caribensis]AUT56809.1 hypothetical protein C2L66_33785 [Paraburkholderia caribensis]